MFTEEKKRLVCHRNKLQRGVTSIEYALITSLICLVIVVSIGTVGSAVKALYDESEEKIAVAIRGALARL